MIDQRPDSEARRPDRRRVDELALGLAGRFGDALRSGDPKRAELVAQTALDAGMDVPAVHSRVIAPAMNEIGDLWQRGAATVADEHLATAISQNVLGRLFPRALHAQPRSRPRIMLAAAQGEHHVLGLRMVADALEGAGFDVLYLGADVPLTALLDACRTHAPAVLGLTVTMPLNVPILVREIEAVCALDQPPAILVAGRAAPLLIAQGLGVPVIIRSEKVVSVVEQLLAGPRRRDVVPPGLALRVPPEAAQDQSGRAAMLTTEDAFSQTALAAAETARDAGRHAYAMEQLAYRDPLTGLWNRRAYDDRFHDLMDGDTRDAAVLMIDVDEFKRINDAFGHEAGDAALIGVAAAMLGSVRPGDFVSRLGGDEFSILLPATSIDEAAGIGERFRASVERELRDPAVTVSVGVVPARGSQRATSLSVDHALYRAKESGRNRVAVAHE